MIVRTYPPRIGGPGTVVQKVSRELVSRGHEVAVVTQSVKGAPIYEVDAGVKVYRTKNISDVNEFTVWNIGFGIISFSKKIFDLRDYDVFHAHDVSVAGFSGVLMSHVISKPFVLKYGGDLVFEYLTIKNPKGWNSVDGLDATLEYRGVLGTLIRSVQRWYFRSYDVIAPDAASCVGHLARGWKVDEGKIRVLVNGVDTQKFSPVNRFKSNRDFFTLVTTGRLIESKGIDVILKALPIVLEKHSVKLLVVGDGPEKSRLEVIARELNISGQVTFLGRVLPSDISKYLGQADIFVFPSFKESTPNSLLEAMSAGLPCIVSDVDGVREVVGDDCALKVFPGDVGVFAGAICQLIESPEMREKLSKNARKRVVDEYSWDKVIENYLRVYNSIVR